MLEREDVLLSHVGILSYTNNLARGALSLIGLEAGSAPTRLVRKYREEHLCHNCSLELLRKFLLIFQD